MPHMVPQPVLDGNPLDRPLDYHGQGATRPKTGSRTLRELMDAVANDSELAALQERARADRAERAKFCRAIAPHAVMQHGLRRQDVPPLRFTGIYHLDYDGDDPEGFRAWIRRHKSFQCGWRSISGKGYHAFIGAVDTLPFEPEWSDSANKKRIKGPAFLEAERVWNAVMASLHTECAENGFAVDPHPKGWNAVAFLPSGPADTRIDGEDAGDHAKTPAAPAAVAPRGYEPGNRNNQLYRDMRDAIDAEDGDAGDAAVKAAAASGLRAREIASTVKSAFNGAAAKEAEAEAAMAMLSDVPTPEDAYKRMEASEAGKRGERDKQRKQTAAAKAPPRRPIKRIYKVGEEKAMVRDFNANFAAYQAHNGQEIIDLRATAAGVDLWPVKSKAHAWREGRAGYSWIEVEKTKPNGDIVIEKTPAEPVWLRHPDRNQHHYNMEVVGKGEKPEQPKAWPIRVEPAIRSARGDVAPFGRYLLEELCGGDKRVASWLLMWLADAVQNPAAKGPGTGIMLIGGQGSGKSLLVEQIMEPILGVKHVSYAYDTTDMVDWSFAHAGKTIVFADEAVWRGDYKLANLLKRWSTARRWEYRRKHQDACAMRNANRIIIASNNPVPMHLDPDDRRWLTLRTRRRYTPEELDNGTAKDEWMPLIRWLFTPGSREAIAHLLLNAKVDREELIHAPWTDAKRGSVLGSQPVLEVLRQLAVEGVIRGDQRATGRIATKQLRAMMPRNAATNNATDADILAEAMAYCGATYCGNKARWVAGVAARHEGDDVSGRTTTFVPQINKARGIQLPATPVLLADAINTRLPAEHQVHDAAASWSAWTPSDEDLEE